ncbi:MAG: hypothetical protein AUK47_12970 [Deltaproteobacteria bacterium CG2_30_63_29]|nr:MAG: hypothetical protein AUK47_12970 [Deltaproteobacteria bacterium CG2_30_63_29]PJB35391.1 MAG: hypothetical protein CO108_25855 [Deltaproteobacteria bacterium CG_4_9_14_3_um_filter_63_12]
MIDLLTPLEGSKGELIDLLTPPEGSEGELIDLLTPREGVGGHGLACISGRALRSGQSTREGVELRGGGIEVLKRGICGRRFEHAEPSRLSTP